MANHHYDYQLKSSGFKEFEPDSILNKHATRSFQKAIYDNVGKKFYIHILKYEGKICMTQDDLEYQAQAQFTQKDGTVFDVEMHQCRSKKTIEEVEEFFDQIWLNMNCAYYEKYHYDD